MFHPACDDAITYSEISALRPLSYFSFIDKIHPQDDDMSSTHRLDIIEQQIDAYAGLLDYLERFSSFHL